MIDGGCLSQGFITVKKHHDHSNSYKGKHLMGAGLQFQTFRTLSSQQEAWWHVDRRGAAGGAKSCTSGWQEVDVTLDLV